MAALAHSILEVVEATGLSRTSIYEDIRAGLLTARKRGRRTIILDVDLRTYLATLPEYHSASLKDVAALGDEPQVTTPLAAE